ncbi:hypothetical protein OXX79_000098 [Metschnikowia pulcherrima]
MRKCAKKWKLGIRTLNREPKSLKTSQTTKTHTINNGCQRTTRIEVFPFPPIGDRAKNRAFSGAVFKWSLVIAGLNDIQRPVEKISGTQQVALFCTGAIWTRWAGFAIKPRNYLLASVNFFLGGVAGYQILRVAHWRHSQGDSPAQVFKYLFKTD